MTKPKPKPKAKATPKAKAKPKEAAPSQLLAAVDPAIVLDANGCCIETNDEFAKLGLSVHGGKRLAFLDADEGRPLAKSLARAIDGHVSQCHLHLGRAHMHGWLAMLFPIPGRMATMVFVPDSSDLAYIDALTGLPNRRDALQRFEIEWARVARKEADGFSIALADVDHFKRINDRYGHEVGDQALRAVAKRLNAVLRKGDWCARWGGEEFLVFLYSAASGAHGSAGCERIRNSVCGRPFISASGSQIPLSISLGVVDSNSYDRKGSITQMISDADLLMYEAKSAGRNRTVSNESGERLFWPREDIRKILRSKQLGVHVSSIHALAQPGEKSMVCIPRLTDESERATLRLMRSARLQEMLHEVENRWFEALCEDMLKLEPTTAMVPLSSPSLLVFERLAPVHAALRKMIDHGHRVVLLARATSDIAVAALRAVEQVRDIGAEFGLRGVGIENVPVELIRRLKPVNLLIEGCKDSDIGSSLRQALEMGQARIYLPDAGSEVPAAAA